MHFLTLDECRDWCDGLVPLNDRRLPEWPSQQRIYARGPATSDIGFCRQLERALQPREACLMWLTDWGIWTGNLHLYYRLRQSYGDHRRFQDAPGHLFLDYEAADLVSYIQVGQMNGWDFHLIPYLGYARAFISHDEYVEFSADEANENLVHEYAAELGGAKVIDRDAPRS